MTEAYYMAGMLENKGYGPARGRGDSGHKQFLRFVDATLYGGVYANTPSKGQTYPNPPIRIPRDDGEHMTEYLRKRIDDIESGRTKMTTCTLDEYMRHLDELFGG